MASVAARMAACEARYRTYVSLCRYIVDLKAIIDGLKRVTKPGKRLTFVLANNTIFGAMVPLSGIFGDLLEESGLDSIQTESRQIRANRRRYPYGITGFKGLMQSEYLIHAKKGLTPVGRPKRASSTEEMLQSGN